MRVAAPRQSKEIASVTVVIPCYNYGQYLPEVVASVLSQARVDVNIIIVDDASTDGSDKTATALACDDPRITLIQHTENQGHIATYNDGLSRVTTPYCMLLSADDLLAPGALARATDLMAACGTVGMVYGRPLDFTNSSVPAILPRTTRSTWTVWKGGEWVRLASFRGRCFILSPEVVVRTEAMREIGQYNPELPHSGDLEYWLRMASRWDVGRINGPAQALYRVHESNMHLVSYSAMATDLGHRLKAFQSLCSPGGPTYPANAAAMLKMARRAVAREALLLAQRELDANGSKETAMHLAEVARQAGADEKSPRYRMYRRALTRAQDGFPPTKQQKAAEIARTQIDRARWRIWKNVGIS